MFGASGSFPFLLSSLSVGVGYICPACLLFGLGDECFWVRPVPYSLRGLGHVCLPVGASCKIGVTHQNLTVPEFCQISCAAGGTTVTSLRLFHFARKALCRAAGICQLTSLMGPLQLDGSECLTCLVLKPSSFSSAVLMGKSHSRSHPFFRGV